MYIRHSHSQNFYIHILNHQRATFSIRAKLSTSKRISTVTFWILASDILIHRISTFTFSYVSRLLSPSERNFQYQIELLLSHSEFLHATFSFTEFTLSHSHTSACYIRAKLSTSERISFRILSTPERIFTLTFWISTSGIVIDISTFFLHQSEFLHSHSGFLHQTFSFTEFLHSHSGFLSTYLLHQSEFLTKNYVRALRRAVLQCVAVCCSALQCVAVHGDGIQGSLWENCSALRCVTVRCSVV